MIDTSQMTKAEKLDEITRLVNELQAAERLEQLPRLRDLAGVIEDLTYDAVAGARDGWGAGIPIPWEVIASPLGMSRQAAWQRWHDFVENPEDSPRQRPPAESERQWWKMNVSGSHIATCERTLRFGTNKLPGSMRPEDVLLLQASKSGPHDPEARIQRALIYTTTYVDADGESLKLWGQRWKYLIVASECRVTKPFSLERLDGLVGTYVRQGQMNHQRIRPEDVDRVRRASGLEDL